MNLYKRSWSERVFHAVSFEGLAIALSVPLLTFLVEKPLTDLGVMAVMVSTIAMLWNVLFNWLFDAAQKRLGFRRDLLARLLHAGLFEAGLVAVLVPLIAWWLSISLWQALVLDIALLLFFLPYTLVFNWLYDLLRARIVGRLAIKAAAQSAQRA